jgi:hypothetical protein
MRIAARNLNQAVAIKSRSPEPATLPPSRPDLGFPRGIRGAQETRRPSRDAKAPIGLTMQ